MPPAFSHTRWLVILLPILACDGREVPTTSGFHPTQISVPGGGPVKISTPTTIKGKALEASEGRMEIVPATATKVGIASTARVRIYPASGYHINTSYPFTLTLAPNANVSFAKSVMNEDDAEELAETGLVIPITMTASLAGTYRLNGSIQFGICREDSCLSRAMPVIIELDAT